MNYYHYNKTSQQIQWASDAPYLVDGKPGELPDDVITLTDYVEPQPEIIAGEKLESYQEVDLETKQYITKWNIVKDVPSEIPLWAFRNSLILNGLFNNVQALVDALPEPDKTLANTHWEYGNFIVRNHPLINTLSLQLGLTETQVDNVFITGSLLK